MVNNPNPRILDHGDCRISQGAKNRKIVTNGPIYNLEIAQRLIDRHGTRGIRVVNVKARQSMASPREFDPPMLESELMALILALREEDHRIGSERCATSAKTEVDCDEYRIRWNRARECESTNPSFGRLIYVKLGFVDNDPTCLVISIHNARH